MSDLLTRVLLAIRVLRCPPERLAVLWESEPDGDGWTAVYSGHVAESPDPYDALESAAESAASQKLMENIRSESDE